MRLYQKIASIIVAIENCKKSNNIEWQEKHTETLRELEKELPHGSGIDCGTKIDLEKSNQDKIILYFSYHTMNENGMYVGWAEHKVIIKPSLMFGFDLRITGKKDNLDYFHDVFSFALNSEI